MIETNKDILRKAIDNLPEREPEPELWSKIESFLDFDRKVSEVIVSLPSSEPHNSLWNDTLAKLEQGKQKTFSLNRAVKYSLAIAATLILMFFVWQRFFPNHSENISIRYSTENKILTDTLPSPAQSQLDSENYIKLSCSREPDRCESPEVSALEYELENLNQQYQILSTEAERYGNDENIMRAYTKIETSRSRVIRELVSKLKS